MGRLQKQEIKINSLDQLRKWIESWARDLPEKSILLLSGGVGAGKTQLVQFLVEAFGGNESSSPSYAIHNRYEAGERIIDHLDLYRLKDDDDLESTGFWDLFEQSQAVIAIEWADRLEAEIFPPAWQVIEIQLKVLEDNSREIVFLPA